MHRKSSGFCSRCKRKLNTARKESFYTMPLTRYVKRAVAMPNEAWRTLWIVPLAALVFAVIADTVVLKPVQRLLRKVRL